MMKQLLHDNPLILMEAAIIEPLRRSNEVCLHTSLVNAPLIYDDTAKKIMGQLYKSYIDIALKAHLPMLVCTPTWRCNQERVYESDVSNNINIEAAQYMRGICDSVHTNDNIVNIGGMIGCKNDCYRPHEGLSVSDAQQFHSWQIEQLVTGGVDFLIAVTLPNIQEALGIAKAMQSTDTPYIISFVISRTGCVLDGSSLKEAIDFIDSRTTNPPLGYMVNCAYPSFLNPSTQPEKVFERLIGYQANASSLDHCDLENATQLEVDSIAEWGNLMIELNSKYGLSILGGCCGTSTDHLSYLTR